MPLNISQALLFWVTVEVLFFSCCDIFCGQGVEQLPKGRACKGRFVFLVWYFGQTESSLVHYDRTWIKILCSCILSCLFGLDLSYNLPHLTEPVKSSQNQSHIQFCCAKEDNRIIWSSLLKQYVIYPVCVLPGCLYYTAAIICMHDNKCSVTFSWHTYWYVAAQL